MSTATGPSDAYADCDEYIEHRISVARSRIKWTDLLTALLLAGVLLLGYVLIFTLFDHWVITGGFAPTTRAVMLGVVVLLCTAIVYRYVIRPWTKEIHPLYAARMLDTEDGTMDGALLSLVDLNASDVAATDTIRRTIEKRAAVGLSEINLDEAIDRKWLMNLGITLFVLVLATCIYAVFSPKSMNLLRPLSLSSAAVATQTRILRVQPGNTAIQSGRELEITADIGGHIPEFVHVLFTTQDKTFVNEQLTMSVTDDAGRFQVVMVGESDRGLRQNFSYRVVAGDAQSEEFQVSVDEPPTASVTRLSYAYPAYMNLPDVTSQNGNIDAWEGTFVSIEAQSNVPLRLAILGFSDDPSFTAPAEEFVLTTNGKELSGRIQLSVRDDGTSPRYFRIDVTDTDGRIDPKPTVYAVKIRPDRVPVVQLIDPIRDIRVPANAIIPLLVQAEDPDFLLRSVKLEYDVNGEPRTPMPLFDATRAGPTNSWAGTWEFKLTGLQLQEGDTVNYHITARDNKPPLGSQSRTGMLKLLIDAEASDEQIQQQLQQDRELQQQQIRERNVEDGNRGQETQERQSGDESQQSPGDDGQPMSQQPSESTEPSDGTNAEAPQESNPGAPASESPPSEPGTDQQPGPSGQTNESDSADPSEAGEQGSSKPEDQASSGKRDVTDNEALQQLLDAYKNRPSDGAASNQPEDDSETNREDAANDSSASANSKDQPEAGNAGSEGPQQPDGGGDEGKTPGTESGSDTQPKPGGSDSQDPSEEAPEAGKNGDGTPESSDEPKPGDQGGEPQTDENKTGESGDQGSESGKQGGESGKQGGESGKQGGESGKQGGESGKQGGESGKQGGESGKQGGESGKQGGESGKQGGESGKQGGESGKQGGESGKQGGESGKQGGESGKQGGESGKQGGESGKQGGESGKQGGESGKQGGESGKQGGESGKQGGESGKQGGESGKQGGESGKQGGESGKQGGESGKEGGKGGGGAAAPDGDSGGKGSVHGKGSKSQAGGTGSGGANPAGGVGNRNAGGGSAGGPDDGKGRNDSSGNSNGNSKVDDPNVDDAAQAADLVLKRLKKDLDRGQVDKELLETLGWTEDQLKAFSERMQKQLGDLEKPADEAGTAGKLQRRRVEELLKSLDLKSKSEGRKGSSKRDREQRDTTSRQAPVPARYKDLMELYQRSLSNGASRKPR